MKDNKQFSSKFILLIFALVTSGYILQGYSNKNIHHAESISMSGQAVKIAAGDTVVITSDGSDLSYDITEIEAVAGTELTIKYVNASSMPHNIILVRGEEDINPVGIAALRAHENEYVPENEMDRILKYTALARPGETVMMSFTVPDPGSYPYICTYPGHYRSMQGRLISVEKE